ncbi:putative nuclease HARBI1 [Pistacia vera]|uniref:putative nuclease HARBI1 n=1 Tax=Pistacia vera TaxID=55513 RepID=UPI001263839A|nr:putative nuclease HARBI1 [Pistacia vera]
MPVMRIEVGPLPCIDGFLYHVADQRRNQNGPFQFFNYRHASLRNVIEKTFGVLKNRFRILEGMNNYSLKRQTKIVMTCCIIHNFIRMFNMQDLIFEEINEDGVYEDEDFDMENEEENEGNGEGSNQSYQRNTYNMTTLRDNITTDMWFQHVSMS